MRFCAIFAIFEGHDACFLLIRTRILAEFTHFSQKIAQKSHLIFPYVIDRQVIKRKCDKNDFPKNRDEKTPISGHGWVKSVFYTPKSQFSRFSRLKIAQNRTKSHLVFLYVINTQAIKRKIEKPHFPKIEKTKNPRVNHHGKPEGKTIN